MEALQLQAQKCMEALQLQVSQQFGPECGMDEIEKFCRDAKPLKNWTKSGQVANSSDKNVLQIVDAHGPPLPKLEHSWLINAF